MSAREVTQLSKKAKDAIGNGEYTDAEYYFKKITKIDETNWQAWYGRGLCFKRLQMYERGIFCFSEVISYQEDNVKGWYNLGFCQSQVNQIEDALFNLNKAIKLDSTYWIAYVIKAWIFKQHGNDANAERLITHVKENAPDFVNKLSQKSINEVPKDYQIAIELLFD